MDEQEQSLPPPHPRSLKILTTAAIFFGNITCGCVVYALAPALEDLRLKYGTTIQDISVVFTVQLIFYCIGAITSGILLKWLNRQLVVIGALTLSAFSLYTIPHCPTELVFFVIGSVLGFSTGIYDSSQVVWIIEIWQEKAGPFIQAQHFFFAIGFNIPSILIAPFLITNTDNTKMNSLHSDSRIYIPLTILGAITTLAVLFQILLFIFYRYYKPPMYVSDSCSEIEVTNLPENIIKTTDDSSFILGVNTRKLKLIAITGIFLGAYQGMEICTMEFVPIFGQYSDLNMTESASAYVLTGLTGMFTLGRAIGVVIILKVRPDVILCVNIVLVIISNIIILIWANNNLTMFWIGCLLLGFGYSTMYPSFCAYMEKYLVFTSAIGSFVCVIGSITAATYPLIVGHIIEKQAVVLTYTNFFSTIVCMFAIAWAYKLVRRIKTRM